MKYEIKIQIENGVLVMENKMRETLLRHCKTLNDGVYKMELRRMYGKRTSGKAPERSNQNGYYWGVVVPDLANHLGYAPDEMHEALKYKFLRNGGSDELPKIGSTSKLDKLQFEDYMEMIRIFALVDYGVKIPLPNEDELKK